MFSGDIEKKLVWNGLGTKQYIQKKRKGKYYIVT